MLNRLLLITLAFSAYIPLVPQVGIATIGLAEWSIYTPGGNIISHVDGWLQRYGDCLRADDTNSTSDSEQSQQVYVSHLKRWRYYKNYVIGENNQAFFIFNEMTKQVSYFSTEKSLLEAVESKQLGNPKSKWLNSQNGWQEAWLPWIMWKPCKSFINSTSASSNEPQVTNSEVISKQECLQAFSPENIALYRETTWGRECRKFKGTSLANESQGKEIKEFCDAVLNSQ